MYNVHKYIGSVFKNLDIEGEDKYLNPLGRDTVHIDMADVLILCFHESLSEVYIFAKKLYFKAEIDIFSLKPNK